MRRAAAAAAGAALLVASTACGSGDDATESADGPDRGETSAEGEDEEPDESSILQALRQSAEQSRTDATAVSYEMEMVMNDAASGDTLTVMDITGSQSWDPVAMDFTMDLGGMAELGEDVPEDSTMTMRMLDEVIYLQSGEFADEFDGRTWLAVDLADEAGSDPEMQELREQMNSADEFTQSPAEQMDLMLASSEFAWLGEEEVDGVTTDLYESTTSYQELLESEEELGSVSEDELRLLADEGDAPDAITYRTWIDGDGYPLRMEVVVKVGDEGDLTTSTQYSDYRTDIGFEAPAAEETISVEEFESAFPGGSELFGDEQLGGAGTPPAPGSAPGQ